MTGFSSRMVGNSWLLDRNDGGQSEIIDEVEIGYLAALDLLRG